MKPVYPEVLTADNTLSISAVNNGDGTVTITIAENQEFLIQDVKVSTTGRTDLSFTVSIPTTAGQVDTYHLRYSLNGRAINGFIPQKNSFYLVNVNDANYNPNALPETDEVFDTKYDDILVARIDISDTGNINILNIPNKQYFYFGGQYSEKGNYAKSYETPLFFLPRKGKIFLSSGVSFGGPSENASVYVCIYDKDENPIRCENDTTSYSKIEPISTEVNRGTYKIRITSNHTIYYTLILSWRAET